MSKFCIVLIALLFALSQGQVYDPFGFVNYLATEQEKACVSELVVTQQALRLYDNQLSQLALSTPDSKEQNRIELQQFYEVTNQLQKISLNTLFESGSSKGQIFREYPQCLRLLADLYYRKGHYMRTTTNQIKPQHYKPNGMEVNIDDAAFYHIYTAAVLNHKQARFSLAVYYENGLIPYSAQAKAYQESQFSFLKKLDPESIIFELDTISLKEFALRSQSESFINLYLSSMTPAPEQLYQPHDFDQLPRQQKEHLTYLNEVWLQKQKQAVSAQLALAYRFEHGLRVEESCETAVAYMEQPARLQTHFVEKTFGLYSFEKEKLNLLGPFVLPEQKMIIEDSKVNADNIDEDLIDLLNMQGDYGSTESLNYLGQSYLIGQSRIEQDYSKAKEFFLKSLQKNQSDVTANYWLGTMYLLGLGQERNVERAVAYYKEGATEPSVMNALGVIYYQAPDYFETDPAVLYAFGSIKKDIKKAKELLQKASDSGNLNARYNLGVLHLDPKAGETGGSSGDIFSYSKAYDNFKFASYKGHTLSSYNLGVMNFLGLGTYKSCVVAKTMLKHVNSVGEQTKLFKRAYGLVQRNHFSQAAWIYMELAEQGFGLAQLNLALLLEREHIFDNHSWLGLKGYQNILNQTTSGPTTNSYSNDNHGESDFSDAANISKQMALKYLQLAMLSREFEDEANLKIADFLYQGTSGFYDMRKADSIFQVVQDLASTSDLRGHALLKLGMIYQFGDLEEGKIAIDNDAAQLFYDKALKEYSSEKAPVLFLSLYNRWQMLNVTNTVISFTRTTIEEPWSTGGILLVLLLTYLISLWSTVSYLRKDIQSDA